MNDPDVLAINAASAALCLSDIPFNGPVGACRVAFVDGEPIPHPTRRQMASSSLNLIVAGVPHGKIVMLEASADDLHVQDFLHAVKVGMKEVKNIVRIIDDFAKSKGKPKREVETYFVAPEDVILMAESLAKDRVKDIMSDYSHDKLSRDRALSVVRDETVQKLTVRNRGLKRTFRRSVQIDSCGSPISSSMSKIAFLGRRRSRTRRTSSCKRPSMSSRRMSSSIWPWSLGSAWTAASSMKSEKYTAKRIFSSLYMVRLYSNAGRLRSCVQ